MSNAHSVCKRPACLFEPFTQLWQSQTGSLNGPILPGVERTERMMERGGCIPQGDGREVGRSCTLLFCFQGPMQSSA